MASPGWRCSIDVEGFGDQPGLSSAVLADKSSLELADTNLGGLERDFGQVPTAGRLHVRPCLVVGVVRVAGVDRPDADPGLCRAASRARGVEVDDNLGGGESLGHDCVLSPV